MGMTEMNAESCDRLDDYLGDDLSPEQRQQFESHLTDCAGCRSEVAAWTTMAGLLRTATQRLETPSEELLTRFTERPTETVPARRTVRASWRGIAVTAACGLLGATLLALPQSSNDRSTHPTTPANNPMVETLTLPADMQLPDDVIGVPVDIEDDSVTVVWLYPTLQADMPTDH